MCETAGVPWRVAFNSNYLFILLSDALKINTAVARVQKQGRVCIMPDDLPHSFETTSTTRTSHHDKAKKLWALRLMWGWTWGPTSRVIIQLSVRPTSLCKVLGCLFANPSVGTGDKHSFVIQPRSRGPGTPEHVSAVDIKKSLLLNCLNHRNGCNFNSCKKALTTKIHSFALN